MTSKFLTSLTFRLVLIVLASSISLANCKPLDNLNSPTRIETEAEKDKREDPLLALPSELLSHQNQQVIVRSQPQIQYVVQQEVQQAQPEPARQQASGHSRQEISYVLVKSEGEAPSNQPDTPVEEDCNQRERGEYVVAASQPESGQASDGRQDYPGEIVYVSQNGDSSQSSSGQEEQESLSSIMSASSGLPATILTEIPVRDMPIEVLEKLKREYGVKVVATRERPGANLVINCDDYAGQGQSICSRQQPSSQVRANGLYPSGLMASPVDDQSTVHLHREPALTVTANPYQLANSEPQQGSYVASDGHIQENSGMTPQVNNQEHREDYGIRTYVAVDQSEQAQPERPEEVSAPLEASAEEKVQAQPEADTHDSGFEAQPEATIEGTEVNKSSS